ncbi:MAG TPA: RNA methyltransferase [Acidimicrobiales bacterium]|nr:RNA methyltransferase [Acidimicrobiales bacterium]
MSGKTPRPDATQLALRHQKVQRLRRLLSRRSAREAEGAFVVEGAKVLSEALDAGAPVESVYVAAGSMADPVAQRAFDAGVRVYELGPGVIERIADTVTPQPLMAVVSFVDRPLAALAEADLLVVAVDVRDPGNAGTVLRSAEAAGAGGLLFCDGSVDVYNPKTVRASAGSLFHVPVVAGGDAVQVLREMASWGVRRLATSSAGGRDYAQLDLTGPVAFVLGNEATGLPPEVEGLVDERVTIPMAGRSESLNVGMAAAVLCFETARQRRQAAAMAR